MLLLAAALTLPACSVAPHRPPPVAQKKVPAVQPPPRPEPQVTIEPVDIHHPPQPVPLPSEPEVVGVPPEPSQPEAGSSESQSPVVVSLLDQSRRMADQGELARASALIERALRIEPRNPRLWSRLARIRFEQQRYQQAEALARKSNRFAQGRSLLLAGNWQLIARVRGKLGDASGMAEARAQAARYQSN